MVLVMFLIRFSICGLVISMLFRYNGMSGYIILLVLLLIRLIRLIS